VYTIETNVEVQKSVSLFICFPIPMRRYLCLFAFACAFAEPLRPEFVPELNSSFGEGPSFSAMITRRVLAFQAAQRSGMFAIIGKLISILVRTTLVAVGAIFAIPIRWGI
jgi:hypothetical protein